MKNRMKSLALKIGSFAIALSMLGAPLPSQAAEASGAFTLQSSTVGGYSNAHRMTIFMTLKDADGISASYVRCVNPSGKLVFTLDFYRTSKMVSFVNESAGSTKEVLNFHETSSANSGGYASLMFFSFEIAALWKRNETCTATTTIEDRLGSVSVVDTDEIRLVNPSIAIQPPTPTPTAPTQSANPVVCAPNPGFEDGFEDKWSAVFRGSLLSVSLPPFDNPASCTIFHTVAIMDLKSVVIPYSGRIPSTGIEFGVDVSQVALESLKIVVIREYFPSKKEGGPASVRSVVSPETGQPAGSFSIVTKAKFIALAGGSKATASMEQLSKDLKAKLPYVKVRLSIFSFSKCAQLRLHFPKGMTADKKLKNKGPYFSIRGYAVNKKLDLDKDGIVCEK